MKALCHLASNLAIRSSSLIMYSNNMIMFQPLGILEPVFESFSDNPSSNLVE